MCNSGILETLVYSEPDAHSESFQTSTLACFVKIVNSYNYFRIISFSRSLLYEIYIMNFFNTGLSFTPEILFLCKIVWGTRWDGSVNFDIPISIRTDELDFKVEEPWNTEKCCQPPWLADKENI